MNVSRKWLNRYIQPSLKIEELAEKLTRIGTPVESIDYPNTKLEGVKAVQVVKIDPHPDAEKLQVAMITDGVSEYQIVTGAPNIQVHQKLFWASPGTELAGGQKIEETVLRGVASMGMLCSASELGLDSKLESEESKGGLLIAHPETVLGESYLASMGLDTELLEFEITANRADCFSMIGIAREASVLTSESLEIPEICLKEEASCKTSEKVAIEIQSPELCSRFTGKVLVDIEVKPSPLWLVQALQSIGLRSINNVVDVTNFVMMEMGQPLHAYDLDRLSGSTLIARTAKPDERLVTLDEKERVLSPQMLVIADQEKAVGIAGVMGGLETEVTEKTTRIVLEGAIFNGPSVRRTSRSLGLRSDASSRFERGVDPEKSYLAVLRAAQLLEEMGAGKSAEGYVDVVTTPYQAPVISFTSTAINAFLGTDITEEEMVRILRTLGCVVTRDDNSDQWLATPPSWRTDMAIFEDLAEEIIRIYGIDTLKATLPVTSSEVVKMPKLSKVERISTDLMAGLGFNQCVHFSFTSPEVMEKLNIHRHPELGTVIPVLNPIVDELSHMKTTLLGSLLETLQKNQAQKVDNLKFFEVARVFMPEILPLNGELPEERLILSAVMTGEVRVSSWNHKSEKSDFYFIKGVGETVLNSLGIKECSFEKNDHPSLHPGRSGMIVFAGKRIGSVGEIHPEVQENFHLTERTYYLEIDLTAIVADSLPLSVYHSFSRFPSSYRDLAFVVSTDVMHEDMLQTIQNISCDFLASSNLFDVYEGDRLPADKKSLGYSFVFQHPDRTLEDQEIDKVIQEIIRRAQEEHGAELRA